jgi:hypothetical protein
MKKLLLIPFVYCLFLNTVSFASHMMGGEITWTCVTEGPDAGKFIFHMKAYRDCGGTGGPTGTESLTVTNYPGFSSIPMNLISQTDISPNCYLDPDPITCAGTTFGNYVGSVEEFVFQSAPVDMSGTPPAAGWIFSWSLCCRNSIVTNLTDADSYSLVLRAVMYSLNNTEIVRCYDESPSFAESPSTVICAGFPLVYNQHAFDKELDSLKYTWAPALNVMGGAALGYEPGYSITSPLPGTTHNPNNIPAIMDSITGEIKMTSFTTGFFVTVVKVQAFKCGYLVAEVYREIQVAIIACSALNEAPEITPPFIDTVANDTVFSTAVLAGDLVQFEFKGFDDGVNGTGPGALSQELTLTAFSNQFGENFSNPFTGCINPPCATLTPAPPIIGTDSVSIFFEWQTDCNHITFNAGCNNSSNKYYFLLSVKDDYCPTPAVTTGIIAITVYDSESPVIEYIPNLLYTDAPGTSFQWFLDGIPIGGATFGQYIPLQNGSYVVRVMTLSGCYKDSPPFVINFIDVNEFSNRIPNIKISPNPAIDVVSVNIDNIVSGDIEIRLVDLLGQVTYKETIKTNSAILEKKIELQHVPAGVYMLNVKSKESAQSFKIVKL